jgi:hypothetical protein
MTAFELAAHLSRCLDEDKLEYAIGGAIALTAWSIPRDTKDVDISIFVPATGLDPAFDSLERAGVMLDRADARRSVERIGMFTGRSGRTLVDVFVGDHPHFHAMRIRRRQVELPSGERCWFVSPDDLCVLKLLFGRSKDIADLERLLGAVPDLDLDYIRGWVGKLPDAEPRLALLDDLVRRFRVD